MCNFASIVIIASMRTRINIITVINVFNLINVIKVIKAVSSCIVTSITDCFVIKGIMANFNTSFNNMLIINY